MSKAVIRIAAEDHPLALRRAELLMDCVTENGFEPRLLPVPVPADASVFPVLGEVLRRGEAELLLCRWEERPQTPDPDLPMAALSAREDPRDALILEGGDPFSGGVIGCSGENRRLQLMELFPGLEIISLEGDAFSQLRQLEQGRCGALVLSAADLKAMGLEKRICRIFSAEELLPAPGQGVWTVCCRQGTDLSCLRGYSSVDSCFVSLAEKAFMRPLKGRGVIWSRLLPDGETLLLRGALCSGQAGVLKGSISGGKGKAELLGRTLAANLMIRELR